MIKIGPYVCTSNNYSNRQNSSLCVKLDNMIMCKMVFDEPICDPLRHVQVNPSSPIRKEFIERLQASGVPLEDVAMLLKPTPTKYFLDKMKKQVK